jgi:hypothetical protein
MDELMELRPVVINGETVYVNRCGEMWRWKRNSRWSTTKFRKIDIVPDNEGYIRPGISGTYVRQHRIIASAFLGLDISDTNIEVDHKNGMRHDNRLENLRLVTHQQNQHNRTKAKGYSWHKNVGKWQASIRLNGQQIHLGLFDSPDDAHNAYTNAKLIYHQIP